MKIIIAVCTYKRYDSLKRCLDSIQKMAKIPALTLDIVVIDNEPSMIVAQICLEKNIIYIPEPQRGLVFARNKTLDYARSENADYLGIIDDDETVSENWLIDMLVGFQTTQADAIAGIIDIKIDETMPAYLKKAYQFKKITSIKPVNTLPMGNIMLGRNIITDTIRFDMRFNFSGGEDIDFFSKLSKRGYRLFKIPNALVTEYLMPEKASLKAYFNRQLRVAKLHYAMKYPSFLSIPFLSECFVSVIEIFLVMILVPFCFISDTLKIKTIKIYAKATGRLMSRQKKSINFYGR